MDKRELILAEAESWLRTPWQHLQDVKGAGVDCAQYLRRVFINTGCVKYFETGHYPPDWMMHRSEERFLEFVEMFGRRVSTPLPGDVAVFKVGHCFAHGAIVVAWPRIIHAFRMEGCVAWGDGEQGFLAGREVRFYTVVG